MTTRAGCFAIIAAASAAFYTTPCAAQFTNETNDPALVAGFTAAENAGAVGARAPGNMVLAGVSRAQARIESPRLGFRVVDTPTISPRHALLIDMINAVFNGLDGNPLDGLNGLVSAFSAILSLQRGGSGQPTNSNTNNQSSNTNSQSSDTSSGGGATVIPTRGDVSRPSK